MINSTFGAPLGGTIVAGLQVYGTPVVCWALTTTDVSKHKDNHA
jgi:hypothetical protein